MNSAADPADRQETNPSIFLRLNRSETAARELAWEEFHQRYASVIAGFARQIGIRSADVDDVVQDVLVGFYATSPSFVYDPARGRFRSYLKTCTFHAVQRRLGRDAKFRGLPLEQVDPEALDVDQVWNDLWEQEQLRRAVEELRHEMGTTKTFRAFEMYVILDLPPQEVSTRLGLHIDNVYRSKKQVTRMLREKLNTLRAFDE
jgi:RNA polymerase sigma factor (sigma-70 family)